MHSIPNHNCAECALPCSVGMRSQQRRHLHQQLCTRSYAYQLREHICAICLLACASEKNTLYPPLHCSEVPTLENAARFTCRRCTFGIYLQLFV